MMKHTRFLAVAAMLVVGTGAIAQGQGRGNQARVPARSGGAALTAEQREELRALLERNRTELRELRARQHERAMAQLSPEVRERLAVRRQHLIRQGRAMERARGAMAQRRGGFGPQRGFGPQGGFGPQRGFGPQGGFGPQRGFRPPGGFGPQRGGRGGAMTGPPATGSGRGGGGSAGQ